MDKLGREKSEFNFWLYLSESIVMLFLTAVVLLEGGMDIGNYFLALSILAIGYFFMFMVGRETVRLE